MQASIRELDRNHALLSGNLTMHNIHEVLLQGNALLKQASGHWQLDMAEVQQVSSAGAALLIEWLRLSAALKIDFTIINFPEALKPILSVSDLELIFQPLLRPIE